MCHGKMMRSNRLIAPKSNSPIIASKIKDTNIRLVSKSTLEIIIKYPNPLSDPTNSPIIAPTTARVVEIFKPAKR